jgi:glucan phosphoethanolaminetransferase (alkaline phosphatase superfamily)
VISNIKTNHRHQPTALIWVALKILAVMALVLTTNPESWAHITLLAGRGQWGTFVPLILIWGVSIAALVVTAIHHSTWMRVIWGLIIAAASAATWGYYWASHSQLSMLDVMSLWNSRHEASRAASFYASAIWWALVLFVAWFAIFALPAPKWQGAFRKILNWAGLLPALPIVMIAGVYWHKNGSTYIPMPSQFNSISLGSLLAVKITTQKIPERQTVAWQPHASLGPKNIVMLMDESLRADYLDFTPGNPYTPHLPALADKFVNYGLAASGGDCSNYSNALVRFGASRMDIVASSNSNATLFDYAKKAGYRTVYIDAQARNITDGNLIQNYMTLKEKAAIDGFYPINDVDSSQADSELADIIAKELKGPGPVFIYANKNGSHFPYDEAYPASAARFHPTQSESATDTVRARIASYRNAVAWSVDQFLDSFFAKVDLSSATVIYTGDHGQRFVPGQLTHCQVEDPDPHSAVVPILVYTSDSALRARFEAGAANLRVKASHFQIAPTLYQLMGYAASDIAKSYDENLFDGTAREPAFTSGDIFGMFDNSVSVHPIDLTKSYLEPEASATDSAVVVAPAGQQG